MMKITVAFLLTSLVVLQTTHVAYASTCCPSWWSIVGRSGVFDISSKMTPINLNCDNFDSILDRCQIALCTRHRKLLSTTAIGTLQALSQCQKLFKDRAWNCSVFDASPTVQNCYLGRFIDSGTRETAFLNAIISAGVAREVARKCKEQELDACGCDFSVGGSTAVDGITITGGCGDNDNYGCDITEKFTDTCFKDFNDALSLATLHNNEVGRLLVKNTSVECVCHGVSGSCSVQTCFKKVPGIEQLGVALLQKYDLAKHVKKDNNRLIPVENSVPSLKEDELGYIAFSPNFCKRDLKNGIYGTSGRRCYPDRNDYTSCASLCCGGLVDQKVVQLEEDRNKCCEFKWCCYLDCSKCRPHNETQYFCK